MALSNHDKVAELKALSSKIKEKNAQTAATPRTGREALNEKKQQAAVKKSEGGGGGVTPSKTTQTAVSGGASGKPRPTEPRPTESGSYAQRVGSVTETATPYAAGLQARGKSEGAPGSSRPTVKKETQQPAAPTAAPWWAGMSAQEVATLHEKAKEERDAVSGQLRKATLPSSISGYAAAAGLYQKPEENPFPGSAAVAGTWRDPVEQSAAPLRKELGEKQTKVNELAAVHYHLKNQEQLARVKESAEMEKVYRSALELEEDLNAIAKAITPPTSYNGMDARFKSDGEAVKRKYGVDDLQTLQRILTAQKEQAVEALEKQGYDYKGMAGYEQMLAAKKRYEENQERIAGEAKDHPLAASALSVLAAPAQGLDYAKGLLNGFGHSNADKLESYVPANVYDMYATNFVRTVRGTVAQQIEENPGLQTEIGGQNVYSFLYQTGMSMADFLFNSFITGNFSGGLAASGTTASMKAAEALSLSIMGAGAASNATADAINRGLSNRQAYTLGAVAGFAEILTEKVSLETLLDRTAMDKNALGYLVKNTLAEGSEEVASDLINLMADVMVSRDKSEWEQSIKAYMDQGYSENEAFGLAVRDQAVSMGMSGLGGALSGGVMAGGNLMLQQSRFLPGEVTPAAQALFAQPETADAKAETFLPRGGERVQKTATDRVAEKPGKYRATKPQNVDMPTVPIINLSVKDIPGQTSPVLSAGNSLRSAAIERARQRLGLDQTSAAYIPASNVMRDGNEYVLKITPTTLKKMLNPSGGGEISVESIVVLDNLERIANNGVCFDSKGDRGGRPQITGFDYLKTTVYIDGVPYEVKMRVRLVEEAPGKGADNVLYYFTPEEIVTMEKVGTKPPKAGLHETQRGSGEVPTSKVSIPQTPAGVNPEMGDGQSVFLPGEVTPAARALFAQQETRLADQVEEVLSAEELSRAQEVYRKQHEEAVAKPHTGHKSEYVGTKATEKLGIKIEKPITGLGISQSIRGAEKARYEAGKALDKLLRDSYADERTRTVSKAVADGVMTLKDAQVLGISTKLVEEISKAYQLQDAYNKDAIKEQRERSAWQFDDIVQELIKDSDSKTTPGVLSLNLNTMQRNNERVWGDQAKEINREIFDPVMVNEAERIRFVNRVLGQMEQFHLNEAESAAVQKLIEGKTTEEELLADGFETKRLSKAAKTLSGLYNDFYDAVNDFLVAHGYKEIGFQKNYAPHMQEENVNRLQKTLQRLGFSMGVTELPTEIAGRTEAFKPGKQYDPYFQHRVGEKTVYDAVGGFESYVNYLSNVLYHTDDIQKLRRFSEALRVKYSSAEMGAQLERLNDLENRLWGEDGLQGADIQAQKEALYERYGKMSKFGGYVSVLDDYTNILAGKQSKADRAIESTLGRKALNIGRSIQNKFSQSAILGNMSSAINQTVQLPQLTAEVGIKNVICAIRDVMTGKTAKSGFNQESDFLTGKMGIQSISEKIGKEKFFDLAAMPFEVVDDFASRVIVRSKYLELIARGMSHEAALRGADQFATRLVGSRMKGGKPVFFEQKNFISKLFSTFQLEVANGWEHIVHDLPMEIQEIGQTKGRSAAIKRTAEVVVASQLCAFIANTLIKGITGREPVPFDGIGMIFNFLSTGYGMTKEEYMVSLGDDVAELTTGKRPLERFFHMDTEGKKGRFDLPGAAGELVSDTLGDVPYISNLASALGVSDDRLPLPRIAGSKMQKGLKDLWMGITAEDEKERQEALSQGVPGLIEGVISDGLTWLPMGNQLNKTLQGANVLARGGSYSGYGDQKKLQYGVEPTPINVAKGLLFGKSALPEADRYYAEGASLLTAGQTKIYQELVDAGVGRDQAYSLIQKVRKAEGGNEKREVVRQSGITDSQKKILYHIISDKRDESIALAEKAGVSFDTYLESQNAYAEINEREELRPGEKAVEFARWIEGQGYSKKQKEALKEIFKYYAQIPAKASSYEKMLGEGLSDDSAYQMAAILSDLTPEDGETVTEMQKLRAVVSSGLSDEEKEAVVGGILQDGTAEKFKTLVEAGLTAEQYVTFREKTDGISADRDKEGNAISGSKKEKMMAEINALLLTPEQKDALYYAAGYSEKTIGEVPWRNEETVITPKTLRNLARQGAETGSDSIYLPRAGETSTALKGRALPKPGEEEYLPRAGEEEYLPRGGETGRKLKGLALKKAGE